MIKIISMAAIPVMMIAALAFQPALVSKGMMAFLVILELLVIFSIVGSIKH